MTRDERLLGRSEFLRWLCRRRAKRQCALDAGFDDAIQRALGDPLNQYLLGELDLDGMWAAWKDNVSIDFPDLSIKLVSVVT